MVSNNSAKSVYVFAMGCGMALYLERNETLEETNFPMGFAVMERSDKIHSCRHHKATAALVPVAMPLLQLFEYSSCRIPSLIECYRKRSFD